MRGVWTILVLVVLVAACGGADASAERVAAQAERVATLLEQDEDCRALEAAATLQTLAEGAALDPEARDAAVQWADQARQHLTCQSSNPEPAPPAPDSDEDAGGNGAEGHDQGRGDTGPPEDRDDGDDEDNEGRGNEGKGNEGKGED